MEFVMTTLETPKKDPFTNGTAADVSTKKEPSVSIMSVSPVQAEDWLKNNHKKNRKFRKLKADEYAADMRAGRFNLGIQVIAFDTNKQLVNGQHVLHAVLMSGVTVRCIVMWNAPPSVLMIADGGMKRSTDDHFTMSGKQYPRGCGSTVRRVIIGLDRTVRGGISDQTVSAFMEQHVNAVAFAHTNLPKSPFASSFIRAPICRAYICKRGKDKLERFCKTLTTGIMSDKTDTASVLLRNVTLALGAEKSGSQKTRADLYALTETALTRFLAGSDSKDKLLPAKEEQFLFVANW